jgi:putrescine importer
MLTAENAAGAGSGSTTACESSPPRLRRVLGLWDLVFYGIVLIQPIGAVGPFGLANQMSGGHVTTAIFVALVAMMVTAVSYGRMAGLYPTAGSAYTFVGRGLNPHLGFIAGWAMFLDYLVIPVVSIVYGAKSLQQLIDGAAPGLNDRVVAALGLPFNGQRAEYVLWTVLIAVLITFLNLRGIKWTARVNQILMAAMCLFIVAFVVQAVRFLWAHQGWPGLLSTKPFYNPETFRLSTLGAATSLAALTYIGFDGITTLAEDVREPKRTVPIAVVVVCLFIGLCAAVQVYLAHQVWPDYTTFKNLDTAFFEVCVRVGGAFLFNAIAVIMAVACIGTALTGQVGAARLLFGMGRDNALPRFFARLDRRNNPALNIGIIGGLALAAALWLDYKDAAQLINFGAFLAFMGVNLAVVREFYFRPLAGHHRRWLADLLVPGLGFLICLALWCSLERPAKVAGGTWCAAGLIYAAIKTRGFRRPPAMIDFRES